MREDIPIRLGLAAAQQLGSLAQLNYMTAAHTFAFSGIMRSPASVLLRRIVSVRSMRSISRHCNPRISQARIVVFRCRIQGHGHSESGDLPLRPARRNL